MKTPTGAETKRKERTAMTFHCPRRLDKKPSEKRESSLYRSICISILSTLLSMVMLVGTTFAWFTSSVKSNVFTIRSGNIDTLTQYSVNLPRTDEDWQNFGGSDGNLFGNSDLLTSSSPQSAYLKLTNNGTSPVVYKISFRTNGVEIEGTLETTDSEGQPITEKKNLSDLLRFTYAVANDVDVFKPTNADAAESGESAVNTTEGTKLENFAENPFVIDVPAKETRYVKLTLAMDPYDGEWKVEPSIDLQLHIFITQPGNEAVQESGPNTQQLTEGMPVAVNDAPPEDEENQTTDPSVKVGAVIEVEEPQPTQEPDGDAENAPSDGSGGQTDSDSQTGGGNENAEGGTGNGGDTGETENAPVTPATDSTDPAATPAETPAGTAE